jgi:hypothetical protein
VIGHGRFAERQGAGPENRYARSGRTLASRVVLERARDDSLIEHDRVHLRCRLERCPPTLGKHALLRRETQPDSRSCGSSQSDPTRAGDNKDGDEELERKEDAVSRGRVVVLADRSVGQGARQSEREPDDEDQEGEVDLKMRCASSSQ